MFWMASCFTGNFLEKADDIVKNNDQVILPGLESETFEWLAYMITTTIRNPDRTK